MLHWLKRFNQNVHSPLSSKKDLDEAGTVLTPSTKFQGKSGQHLIEYSILIILVLAGIIIAGPYVIRSWNAQVKSWDDSVTESLEDPLLQAPPDIVSVAGCNPDPAGFVPQGCDEGGSGVDTCLGYVDCLPTQRLDRLIYNPVGCECFITPVPVTAQCIYDCNCCTVWSPDPLNPADPIDPFTDCGVNAPITGVRADGLNGCPDGQYLHNRTCGDPSCGVGACGPGCTTSVLEIECVPHSSCNFSCQGALAFGFEYCDSGTPGFPSCSNICVASNGVRDDQGLANNLINWRFVSACTDGRKCEVRCNTPGWFEPQGAGCVPGDPTTVNNCVFCDCPLTMTDNNIDRCICAPLFVKECPTAPGDPNQCFQGSCGVNECEQ